MEKKRMEKKREPSEVKKGEIETLKGLLTKYRTIGLLDIKNLPSPQLQNMRKKLEEGEIRVTKKRLLRIALKEIDKGVEKLEESLEDIVPGLILTDEGSFKLARFLRKSKSQVAAKAGQIAPKDLVVNAGATTLPPGPIIGELGAAGVKASVEKGKVTVKQDCVVVKQGEVIKGKVADILSKLGIKPMEIGLNLVATFENGNLFRKEVLDVDERFYLDKLREVVSEAINLSVKIGYITKENIHLLLRKAQLEVLGLDKVVNAGRDKVKKDLATADKEAGVLAKKVEEKKLKEELKPGEDKEKESSDQFEKKEEEKDNTQGGN